MYSIKITSGLSDLETIVGILVKNDYIVRTERVMKDFPYENCIDYYLVTVTYRDKE